MSLRRAAAATVLSTALATAGALAPVGSATAADPTSDRAAAQGCVTKAEYRKIKKGMTMATVKRITGTGGTQVSKTPLPGGKFVIGRAYQACTSKRGGVGIAYTNASGAYKVASKSAAWG